MGATGCGENWVLLSWAGPCSVNLQSNFQLMFPPCSLSRGQTMTRVMAVTVTSFRRTPDSTVVSSAPDPTADHCQPTPPPETPGHSQASLAQSLLGSLLLSPGSWCTEGFVCALQEFVSSILWMFCNKIPLAFKVKSPGSSQSFGWISSLGNLLWALELLQQCKNFFGIIVLRFVGRLSMAL